MKDRVVIVTGANTGIGRATAAGLAARGARVFLACRSEARAATAVEAIRRESSDAQVGGLTLDLGDLLSVRACAEAFLARDLPLHVLINNAGLAGQRGLTASGFELTFGVNHVGHFALTMALLDRLEASAPARVVNVSSRAHFGARPIDYEAVRRPTASVTGVPEYRVSKLANVLFTAELARRLAGTGVTTYAVHPGVISSEVWRAIPQPFRWLMTRFMSSAEDGARTSLHCATAPELAEESGLYYDDLRAKAPSAIAREPERAAELWAASEAWIA